MYPEVARERGHYESFYLRASHPSEPLGVWIRHTVHKPSGGSPSGSGWFGLLSEDGASASKVTLDDVGVPDGGYIRVGDATFAPGRAVGSAPSEHLAPS